MMVRRYHRVGCTFFKRATRKRELNRWAASFAPIALLFMRICIENGLAMAKIWNPSSLLLVISISLLCDTLVENYKGVRMFQQRAMCEPTKEVQITRINIKNQANQRICDKVELSSGRWSCLQPINAPEGQCELQSTRLQIIRHKN